jgi:hypothetical protein
MAPAAIVPSPGAWESPSGARPAWNWVPPGHGLSPRLDRVPRWVRIWFGTPFIDRFAYAWMWHHGGWDVIPPVEPGPENIGDREPLVPKPSPPTLKMARDLTAD